LDSRGESGVGTWTVIVKDTEVNDKSGTFIDWHLKLWGEAKDPKIATLLPMPSEADDKHNQIETTTIAATITSITTRPTDSPSTTTPTNHPDRPVKPTGLPEDGTSSPTTSPTSTAPSQATATESSWLPSFFPTFGVSARTQIWIYGSLALIAIFCSGLGIYFYLARRRRLRNISRDNYEFDLVADEEAEGLTQGGVPGENGRRTKRRAGELYDAFAAGSEDEEDGFSGDEGKVYRDDDGAQHVIGDDEDDESPELDGDEKTAESNLLKKD
jgi:kexin